MYLRSSFILRYVGAEMNVHAFMNELDQKDYWYPRKFENLKIYVQSQWRVVLLWYHIFWQSSIQRGRHTQLCIITSLKWIIQICSNFTVGFVKLLSTHPIHILFWGNFPFKNGNLSEVEEDTTMSNGVRTETENCIHVIQGSYVQQPLHNHSTTLQSCAQIWPCRPAGYSKRIPIPQVKAILPIVRITIGLSASIAFESVN